MCVFSSSSETLRSSSRLKLNTNGNFFKNLRFDPCNVNTKFQLIVTHCTEDKMNSLVLVFLFKSLFGARRKDRGLVFYFSFEEAPSTATQIKSSHQALSIGMAIRGSTSKNNQNTRYYLFFSNPKQLGSKTGIAPQNAFCSQN